ncbi:hypothetical protein [Mucilaginibacter sp.]|uniref:hypothetical protein n=1 Tax=Mucilaginibacter sp. TaxID=1882438 RepID=UPI003D0A9971
MKKMFTRLFSTALLTGLILAGVTVKAQTTSLNSDAATTTTAPESVTAEQKAEAKAEQKAKAEDKATVKKENKAAEDTSWKPQRRIWGYAFGDLYYDAHADKGGRGGESNYAGVPTGRNAFQLRRVYLGYDYEINKRFKAQLLLSTEPTANTSPATLTSVSTTTITGAAGVTGKTTTTTTTTIPNGDNLADNKMAFFIKNINLRYRDLFEGTDLVVGEMSTPGFALNEPGTNAPTTLSENVWSYRSVERTITDFHKNNSYDLGAALQGTFDVKTKNFGYVAMVANNSTSSLLSAANANTGFYKIFYGDLWGKFLNKKLVVDFYADYAKTGAATYALGPQEHNMFKAFAAYTTPKLTVGVEAYTQKIANGISDATTKIGENATVNALSIFARGAIVKDKIGFFARFDTYNPDKDYNGSTSYTVNTNYGSYTPVVKEKFYTAGLDFTPAKGVHFMPNIWLIDFKDNRDATTAGYVTGDHTLVYRATFYYVFGK